MKKFSDFEVEFAKHIGKRYQYIARDKDDALACYRKKPSKLHAEEGWSDYTFYGEYTLQFDDIFPSIKWEDDEPTLIKEIIENKDIPLLDKKEKEYLENVIRPWKDEEVFISKDRSWNVKYEYLTIQIKDYENDAHDITLPRFKKGAMYKGLEVNEMYTLEELGLFENDSNNG